jgi:hypothetical protein
MMWSLRWRVSRDVCSLSRKNVGYSCNISVRLSNLHVKNKHRLAAFWRRWLRSSDRGFRLTPWRPLDTNTQTQSHLPFPCRSTFPCFDFHASFATAFATIPSPLLLAQALFAWHWFLFPFTLAPLQSSFLPLSPITLINFYLPLSLSTTPFSTIFVSRVLSPYLCIRRQAFQPNPCPPLTDLLRDSERRHEQSLSGSR